MAKQQKTAQGRYVRKETLLMVSLLALAVGFFGGVVFTLFQSDSKKPVPPAPAQMRTPAPASGGADRIAALERQTQADPGNIEAWTELGNAYFDSNENDNWQNSEKG